MRAYYFRFFLCMHTIFFLRIRFYLINKVEFTLSKYVKAIQKELDTCCVLLFLREGLQ